MAKTIREPTRSSGLGGIFDWAKEIVKRAILDGRIMEEIDVDTTGVSVDHGLDRVPRGVIVVKSSTDTSYSTSDFTVNSFTITAKTGTPVVSVWVF